MGSVIDYFIYTDPIDSQGLPMEEIEAHNRTGRPLGNNRFLKAAEKITGRDLIKKKPGSKSKGIN